VAAEAADGTVAAAYLYMGTAAADEAHQSTALQMTDLSFEAGLQQVDAVHYALKRVPNRRIPGGGLNCGGGMPMGGRP
jgi:methyl coenzyme M reductase beta subunit